MCLYIAVSFRLSFAACRIIPIRCLYGNCIVKTFIFCFVWFACLSVFFPFLNIWNMRGIPHRRVAVYLVYVDCRTSGLAREKVKQSTAPLYVDSFTIRLYYISCRYFATKFSLGPMGAEPPSPPLRTFLPTNILCLLLL